MEPELPTGSAPGSSAFTDRRAPWRARRGLLAGVAALLLALALGLRLNHVLETPYRPVFDAGSYLKLASEIAHTGDYSLSRRAGNGAGGTRGPSAYFPPGYPYLLAAVDLLDGHPDRSAAAVHGIRVAQTILGTVSVGLLGLIALELFGAGVALATLALAAVYPVMIELTGTLVAENLLTTLVLAMTWAALRARRSERPLRWLLAAGALAGAAWLTHANGVLLLIPLVFAARSIFSNRRLLVAALVVAAALLVVLPWTIRNAIVMHRLIPVTDETGITLVGTYNHASAANPTLPYKWRTFAAIPGERAVTGDTRRLTEPELDSRLEEQALDYISGHPLAPAAVAYHNTLRLLELAGAYAWHASARAQGLARGTAREGVTAFWILCLLALAGCATARLRRAPGWLWAIPGLLALSVVLVNVETPRFRAPVDPFLFLPAACAVVWAAERAVRAIAPYASRA